MYYKFFMSIKIKIRIGFWLLLLVSIFWFVYMAVVPSGRIEYVYNFEKKSGFISPLKPNDRVGEIKNGKQKIIGDPVYFSLRTSRDFSLAKLAIEYQDYGLVTPIIEAGVLVDKKIWRYDLKPLQNSVIDNLSLVWETVRDGDVILLQKEKKYSSINDFLHNPPPANMIATYNYTPPFAYVLADYTSSTDDIVVDIPLRGSFEIFTYIHNEPLSWRFKYIDLNLNKDADNIELLLYYQGKLIGQKKAADDGIINDNGEISAEKDIYLYEKSLPPGVYKLEFKVNDDIVINKIITRQNKISFNKKIRLYAAGKKNITLYTDSTDLNFTTVNPESLQEIEIGSSSLSLKETYRQFSKKNILNDNKITKINLTTDGVTVAGNGMFSFERAALFNPVFRRADGDLQPQKQNIKYVIARYALPTKINVDDKKSVALFNIHNAYHKNNTYGFIISIPGLKADDDIDDFLSIKSIKISLSGDGIWQMLKSKFYQ